MKVMLGADTSKVRKSATANQIDLGVEPKEKLPLVGGRLCELDVIDCQAKFGPLGIEFHTFGLNAKSDITTLQSLYDHGCGPRRSAFGCFHSEISLLSFPSYFGS